MRSNQFFMRFFLLISCLFLATTSFAQNDPVSLLRHIADNMIAGLKANQATLKNKPSIVYDLAYKYVVPYADLPEMSKRVLPPQVWNNATPAERAQFQKSFTTTIVRTYASALASYQDQTIQFYPIRGALGKTVEVNSQISSPQGQPINVTYRMVQSGGAWKLYDMTVEGVDMLDSFRAQFSDILAQGDMSMLLKRISSHNTR